GADVSSCPHPRAFARGLPRCAGEAQGHFSCNVGGNKDRCSKEKIALLGICPPTNAVYGPVLRPALSMDLFSDQRYLWICPPTRAVYGFVSCLWICPPTRAATPN